MKRSVNFIKMSGSGNDFIVIDNRNQLLNGIFSKTFVKNLCTKGLSVGSDGLILIEKSKTADFKWRYFNADGEEVTFCGNGSRCAAFYAVLKKISSPSLTFETQAGIVKAQVKKKSVKVSMMSPSRLEINNNLCINQKKWEGHYMILGVPHWIHFSKDIDLINVNEVGRQVRFHPEFMPEGTNANFVDLLNDREIRIRTFERGVEAETLACGTGAVASVLMGHKLFNLSSPVTAYPKGNIPLRIYFKKRDDEFTDIYLEGDSRVIYEGILHQEAWDY